MKKYYYLLVFLLLQLATSSVYAQNIGINSSGALPDSSSVLDLSSTSMGLLTPRMTTAQRNAITRPANGLMVYNTTLSTFEVNSGTSSAPVWVTLITSVKTRSNYVLVKSAADFPAAVGGVRILDTHTLYEINGTIVMTDKIDLNGAAVLGQDATEDILVYPMTSGELFTGANGGSIRFLTLAATGVGSKLFNVNANGSAQNFIIENCFIVNCNNIGLIKGFNGTIFMSTVAYQNNLNGITFENDKNVLTICGLWDSTNHNTYEKYIGTFNVIQKLGGATFVKNSNAAIGLDVSGITSISGGSLKTNLYIGDGTFLTGNFTSKWEVETSGFTTEKDDVAKGNFYITTSAATTLVTVNAPLKASGTTTSTNLFRFTMPADNRLTYTGTKNKTFSVTASLSYSAEANNKTFSIYIYKNGVVVPGSKMSFYHGTSTQIENAGTACMVTLAANDYIELWVENNTDNKNITIEQLNLTIK